MFDIRTGKKYSGEELYHPGTSQHFAGEQHALDILGTKSGLLKVVRTAPKENERQGTPYQSGQTWVLPVEPIPEDVLQKQKEALIEKLWRSATSQEEKYISGSARSLVTIGILKSLPKCLVVQQWVGGIWADYYTRKAQVMAGDVTISTDFSSHGPTPHTAPELREEVGL